MLSKLSRLIFIFFLAPIGLQAGNPDLFYYVSDGSDELYSINRSTNAISLIGSTGVTSIEAIAYYPIPGANQLFACNAGDFGSLNISTGAFSLIGEVDGGGTANGADGPQTLNDVDGLMLDAQTFKMWAIERNGGAAADYLFQIDVSTGQFVPNAFGAGIDYLVISGTGVDVDADDLAVDPTSGQIYASSNDGGTGDVLIRINKFTGVFTFVSTLSQDDVEGLAFSNDGTLYGAEGDGDNRLGEINISTGVVSNFIGFTGSDVEALASLVADANTVSGTVFDDTDLDGVKDGGEAGLADVTVYLYKDNNGDGKVDPEDTRVQTTTTDVNGDYAFYYATTGNLLTSTSYFSYPSGYALTTNNVESISFTDGVNFAEVDASNDFGLGSGPDCDGDGLPNFFEGGGDADLDAIPDSCDLDSDNDGIRDDVEGIEDFDDDGILDYLDRDSDDDGIPDALEANGGLSPTGYDGTTGNVSGADADNNGIVDALETAAGSGIMVATVPDSDNDGRKDYRDLDSDNDGILDIIEGGGTDSDGDGQVDVEADFNQNGYSDLLEANPYTLANTDSADETADGQSLKPDYIDIDSDGDGIDDTREGYSTSDYGFPSLILDSDDDGIVDFWDVSADESPITPYDRDGDGIPDYQDSDSDNDGVSDFIEGNDADNDGAADIAKSGNDDNNNGLDDAFDSDCTLGASFAATDWGEEDNSDGSMYLTSSDLELCDDGGTNQTVGIYFPNVAIDQGVTVNSAFIQFEADESDAAALTITIQGELASNAASFTAAANNVSSRTPTANSESWTPAAWTAGDQGADQLTVDISSIINEILAQGAWESGNNMVLIFTSASGNERTAEVDPSLVINLDAVVCSSAVAVQDFDGDGELDFRDTDDDDDGIPSFSEIPDTDGSGTPDYLEVDVIGTCGSGFANTYATFESEVNDVTNETFADGPPDGNFARIYNNNETLTLDFKRVFLAGTTYDIVWRKKTTEGSAAAPVIDLSESDDNVTFTNHPSSPSINDQVNFVTTTVTSNVDFRYLRFDKGNSSNIDYELDAVRIDYCLLDSDFDGISDLTDIDDDNDGILDIDEATACSGYLFYEFYDGATTDNTVDNIPNSGALATGTTTNFDVDAIQAAEDPGDAETFAIRFKGFISIATTETYTFYSTSDDGSKVFIDGIEVVENDGLHAAVESSGTIDLIPGVYSIEVLFFENTGGEELSVSYSSASITKTNIPFSVLSSCDSDLDGIPNHLDLDSDNDGISDIIEAGGSDADNNGRSDDYSDGDGDGWTAVFDSDDGGTALTDPDTDGDGISNRVDIDSDNDGIVDAIEAQISGTSPRLPSGVDSDGDGIDDNFDSDSGNALLIPVNTDGVDNPDYTDTDTDNDGISDLIEAYDTDQDNISNTIATGSDDDGDGLDNAFDNVSGLNSSSNVSNNSQNSDSFPDDDNPVTEERDWREFSDRDGDGIADEVDVDDDNDGILDTDECPVLVFNGGFENVTGLSFGNNIGDDISPWINSGTNNVIQVDGAGGSNYGAGGPEVDARGGAGNYYDVASAAGTIYQTFTLTATAYVRYHAFYAARDGSSGDFEVSILSGTGTGGAVQSTSGVLNTSNNSEWQFASGAVTLAAGTYTFLLDISNPMNTDEASISIFCDSDGDGIPNQYDLDSDGDGISDIIEAGGVDTDGDGRVDDNTDTDNDGWADTFDNNNGGVSLADSDQDGDGFPNRVDLDADNDGIADVIEAGGEDANGDGRADGTDSNENGWVDVYDETAAGTNLTVLDSDGDGLSNYLDLDSDNDGITDNVEGQLTVGFRLPSGTDADDNGWDDEYDGGNGGTVITLSNNDGAGDPDYFDLDSDGDGLYDWSEGFDDNLSLDALDDMIARADAYEIAAGAPGQYVNGNDGDTDGIPNWLEDDDADNLPNFLDPDNALYFDSDNDGLVNLFDTDNNGLASNLPDNDVDGEYDFRDIDNMVSLPIELLDFTAEPHNNWVELNWTTATEVNNQWFEIQRLNQDREFVSILREPGAGNSLVELSYRVYDQSPLMGVNYYRLKQIDFDGKMSYTDVKTVKFSGLVNTSEGLSIYPNPGDGSELNMVINEYPFGVYELHLMDAQGRVYVNRTIELKDDTRFSTEILKGMKLPSGVYLIHISGPEKKATEKYIVY